MAKTKKKRPTWLGALVAVLTPIYWQSYIASKTEAWIRSGVDKDIAFGRNSQNDSAVPMAFGGPHDRAIFFAVSHVRKNLKSVPFPGRRLVGGEVSS